MDTRDEVTIRRIAGDREAIEALGRAEREERQELDVAARSCAQAALMLLRYAGDQDVFDALFRLAFRPAG